MLTLMSLAALQAAEPIPTQGPVSREPQVSSEAFISREPLRPRRRTNSTEIVCGDDVLQISGYGDALPRGATPEVSFNGRRLTDISFFEEDLRGRPGGVFRISGSCAPWENRIYVRIAYAQRLLPNGFSFQSGGAIIENGELEQYRSLREANPDSFWEMRGVAMLPAQPRY